MSSSNKTFLVADAFTISEWVKIIVVKTNERGHFFIRRLPLVQKHLDLGLQERILLKLAEATSRCCVLFAIEAATVGAHRRDVELGQGLDLEDVPECLHNVSISTQTIRADTGVEAGREVVLIALEAEEENVDWASLDECVG